METQKIERKGLGQPSHMMDEHLTGPRQVKQYFFLVIRRLFVMDKPNRFVIHPRVLLLSLLFTYLSVKIY